MTVVAYWGPLFPDSAAAPFVASGVKAQLELQEPVTFSGAFDTAIMRALAEGAAGNDITIEFIADALTVDGELEEDTLAKTVLVKFIAGATTVQMIRDLLASGSSLVELTGPLDLTAVLVDVEDEFGPIALFGGSDQYLTTSGYWGPLFPDRALTTIDPTLVAGVGPLGAAQFALSIEAGFAIVYEWITDVFKSHSGVERRASLLSRPRQTYAGGAHLVGDQLLAIRGQIERFAALGSTFLLGMPHKEATLLDDADGFVVSASTELLEWAISGQRVAVLARDGSSTIAVIQSATSDSITLDTEPGDTGAIGGSIMPLVPIVLDAQQGFARHPVPRDESTGDREVEQWLIRARSTSFGFESNPVPARLALGTEFEGAATFGITVVARTPGADGNNITFFMREDSEFGNGELIEDVVAKTVAFRYQSGITTVSDFESKIALSTLVTITGTFDPDALLNAPDDEVNPATNLAGGVDGARAVVGLGAILNTYAGKPIFDRGVDVSGTSDESVQTMADIVDLGGAPSSVGTADEADWGRRVAMSRTDREEFAWLELFLWTVRGRWKTFWLPTHRCDLLAIGNGPGNGGGSGELLIDSTVGDFEAWFPKRRHIQVRQESGDYNLLIEGYQDNGDGTITLEILADPDILGATTPADEPIDSISWLELCRLEKDQVTIRYNGAGFSVDEIARAVQR